MRFYERRKWGETNPFLGLGHVCYIDLLRTNVRRISFELIGGYVTGARAYNVRNRESAIIADYWSGVCIQDYQSRHRASKEADKATSEAKFHALISGWCADNSSLSCSSGIQLALKGSAPYRDRIIAELPARYWSTTSHRIHHLRLFRRSSMMLAHLLRRISPSFSSGINQTLRRTRPTALYSTHLSHQPPLRVSVARRLHSR
jgi:hypothetical protein